MALIKHKLFLKNIAMTIIFHMPPWLAIQQLWGLFHFSYLAGLLLTDLHLKMSRNQNKLKIALHGD